MDGAFSGISGGFENLLSPRVRVAARPMPDLPKGPERRARELEIGRACAADALARLGAPRVAVATNADGSPAWPAGTVGSLTHTRDFVVAAVAHGNDTRGLGIDAEETMCEEAIAGVAGEVTCDSERQLVAGVPETFTAIFSAKESLFKCVYPLAGVYFDFADARATRVGSTDVELVLTRDVGAFATGSAFSVRWSLVQGHVLTALELGPGRTAPPAPGPGRTGPPRA